MCVSQVRLPSPRPDPELFCVCPRKPGYSACCWDPGPAGSQVTQAPGLRPVSAAPWPCAPGARCPQGSSESRSTAATAALSCPPERQRGPGCVRSSPKRAGDGGGAGTTPKPRLRSVQALQFVSCRPPRPVLPSAGRPEPFSPWN